MIIISGGGGETFYSVLNGIQKFSKETQNKWVGPRRQQSSVQRRKVTFVHKEVQCFFAFCFWLCPLACRSSEPGMEPAPQPWPGPQKWYPRSLTHWATRELLQCLLKTTARFPQGIQYSTHSCEYPGNIYQALTLCQELHEVMKDVKSQWTRSCGWRMGWGS